MAITQNYVDPVGGLDANPGTLAQPWQTLQHAFDNCVRNIVDGNQINLKSSGPHVNAATLSLAAFIAAGALSNSAPLIVRGYTAAANDGGIGEIDCNGVAMWAATTYDYIILADLEIHNGGDNNLVVLDTYCMIYRCEVHKGASAPNNKYLISAGSTCAVLGCYVHDIGTGTARGISMLSDGQVRGNYVDCGAAAAAGTGIVSQSLVIANIVLCRHVDATGILTGSLTGGAIGNAIYNTAAGVNAGVYCTNLRPQLAVMNNIVVGWSGAGGAGIEFTINAPLVGYNAFYNNTANYSIGDQTFLDLTANDIALAASPFTNPAAGDFSLTAAGKTALRGLGWPAAYLGAHANTDGHITIGPIQYGEASGGAGAVSISPFRGNIG